MTFDTINLVSSVIHTNSMTHPMYSSYLNPPLLHLCACTVFMLSPGRDFLYYSLTILHTSQAIRLVLSSQSQTRNLSPEVAILVFSKMAPSISIRAFIEWEGEQVGVIDLY